MNCNFLEDHQFIQHKQDNRCYLFKNIQHPLPTWADVMENFDMSVKNKWPVNYFNGFGFATYKAYKMPYVGELLEYISTLDSSKSSSAHRYFSLGSFSKTHGRHNDDSDVFFWQIIGKTKWTLENKEESVVHILEPNDLLFVPRKMWHDTKPLMPRAGISFGIDYY